MDPQQGTTLRLHGTLDDESCVALRRDLARRLAAGARHVVLDLASVDAIGAAGIRMLDSLDRHLRAQQGALLLVNPTRAVATTLKIYELDSLMQIRDLEPARPVPVRKPAEPALNVVPLARRA